MILASLVALVIGVAVACGACVVWASVSLAPLFTPPPVRSVEHEREA